MGNSSSSTAPTFSAASKGTEVAAAYPGAAAGKTYLVTGGAGGLGFETARVLAASGAAEVVVAARSQARCDEAVSKLKAAVPAATFSTLVVDLADLNSVQAAAASFLATGKPLHGLINNAGIMAAPYAETAQGVESQFGTNHLGHFALTQGLMPALKRSAPSRVVNLSSLGNYLFAPPEGIPLDEVARRGTGTAPPTYEIWRAYGISKLANVLHAAELNRRGGGAASGVAAVAVHPGAIMGTELKRNMTFGVVMGMLFDRRVLGGALGERNKSIEEGAANTILATLAPFEGTPAAAAAPLALKPGGYYADCKLMQPGDRLHVKAADEDLARRLWEASERLVKEAATTGAMK